MTEEITNPDIHEDARIQSSWESALTHYDRLCVLHDIERDQIGLEMEPRPYKEGWSAAIWAIGPLLGRFENMVCRGAYEGAGETAEFHRQANVVIAAILRRMELADELGLDIRSAWQWQVPEEHMLVHPMTLRFSPRHPQFDVHEISSALSPHFECEMDVGGNRLAFPIGDQERDICRIQTNLVRSWIDLPFEGDERDRQDLLGQRLRDVPGALNLPRCPDDEINAIVDDLTIEDVDYYPSGPNAGKMVRIGVSRTTWLPYRPTTRLDTPAHRHPVVA